jgi:hypothetical protein
MLTILVITARLLLKEALPSMVGNPEAIASHFAFSDASRSYLADATLLFLSRAYSTAWSTVRDREAGVSCAKTPGDAARKNGMTKAIILLFI